MKIEVPKEIPPIWQQVPSLELPPGNPVSKNWVNRESRLLVCRSESEVRNGQKFYHVSVSHHARLPTYDELCEVKKTFLGDNVAAYQVFAKRSDHINIHNFCLHLWLSIDGHYVANLQDLEWETAH